MKWATMQLKHTWCDISINSNWDAGALIDESAEGMLALHHSYRKDYIIVDRYKICIYLFEWE